MDKPDEAIFNDKLDALYSVAEAKDDYKKKDLFKKLVS